MGAPYSQDLRLRVLAALDEGMGKTKAHQQFKVSRSTIDDWLNLRQETGEVEAKTDYRRGCPPALGNTVEVRTFIEAHKHSTLTEMVQRWQQEQGATLSTMAFSRALKRHGYSCKKRATAIGSVRQQRGKPLGRS